MKALGLETLQTCDTVTKPPRIPTPTKVCNAVAIQRGTERPNDVVIITGHIDSRVSDPLNFTADAPGANDDGSGTAAVLEAARVLSQAQIPRDDRLCRAVGRGAGAQRRQDPRRLRQGAGLERHRQPQQRHRRQQLRQRRRVRPTTRCGSSPKGCAGRAATSSAPRSAASAARTTARRATCRATSIRSPTRSPASTSTSCKIWRNDRFGRGGDHTEFLNAGFPAVRMSVAVEDYDHQHQDLRTENGTKFGDTIDEMDFRLSRQGDQAQRRGAGLDRLRSAAARSQGRRRGQHRYDGQLESGRSGASAMSCAGARPIRNCQWQQPDADNCIASDASDDARTCGRWAVSQPRTREASGSTIGCSAWPRRSPPRGKPGCIRGARRRVQALCETASEEKK